MPSKSMSPMQTKIGEASLKFGPDWLRALSSDGNGSGGGGNRWSSGSGGGGGGGGGSSGNSGGYSQQHSEYSPRGNQMDYHQYQQHQYKEYKDDGYYRKEKSSFESPSSGGGNGSGKGNNTPTFNPNRFKPSDFKYSREEMLSLYDKNLTAPSYLPNNNGALFVEKMQPPLAFSQPSEDEIRIWHSAQPESSSSRGGGNNLGPSSGSPGQMGGRGGGFAIRGGRGGGIERGRGRGRGYYNMSRPSHEEDDRTFNRPRTFERSQSAHERVWIERNGIPTGPPPPGGLTNTGHSPSESDARSGNWRSKGELPPGPYNDGASGGGGPGVGRGRGGGEMNVGGGGGMGRGRYGEDEDGWRRSKQHWRREEEEEGGTRNRRLHKSWSEDGMHDNLPEWARDNPSEESGTFDSKGAFHDDRHSSTTKQYELKRELRESKSDTEPYGSQNDKVQKRTPERNENIKSVIPPSVKEEIEPVELTDKEKYSAKNSQSLALSSSYSRSQSESSDELVRQQQQQQHQQQQKKNKNNEQQQRRHPSETDVSSQQQQQHILQQQEKLEYKLGKMLQQQQQQQQHQNMTSSDLISGHSIDIRHDMKSHQNFLKKQTPEEDHFMSLTEEAFVAKLIEEDGLPDSRRISNLTNLESNLQVNKQQQQQQHHNIQSQNSTNFLNSTNNNIKQQQQQQQHNNSSNSNTNLPMGGIQPNSNILQGIPLGQMNSQQQQQQQQLPSQKQAVPPITEPLGWLYLDPQGSVQGPFSSAEMAQWFLQGYFSGDLLLRRSCDKHFIPLDEMGKIYDRNPFINTDSNPPPPILDPIPVIPVPTNNPQSALNLNNIPDNISPAQFHQRQQQQQIRHQQQDVHQQMNLGHGIVKDGWGAPDGTHQMQQQSSQQSHQQQQQQQQQQRVPQANLSPEHILMLNFAKSQGVNLENVPNTLDALQTYFQTRQMKEQFKNMTKADFINSLMTQLNSQQQQQSREAHNKSSIATQDPIQNLVQQLTNLNQQKKQHLPQPQPPQQQQQQQQINNANKIIDHQWGTAPPPQGTPWGMQATPQPPQQQQQQQQPQQQGPNFQQQQQQQSPWEYREQLLKYQTKMDEEIRRRQELDVERKRLEDEEIERKKIEEQQKRLEEEQKRKILEEKFLMQQKQEELMKQQQAAEMARQKELAHQKLIQQQQQILQQQQMEHQQRLEQQRMAEELKKQQQQQQQQQQAEQQRIQQEQLRQQQEQQQRQFTWQQHQQQQQQQQSNVIQQQQQNRNVQSLVEIQQEEARKQQEDDIIRQALKKKQMLLQQAEQQRQREMQQKSGLSLAWANQSAPAQSQGAPIKSLKEIQAEEQAKLAMQQEKERQNRAEQFQNQQQQQQWSSTLTWANRAKLNTSNKTNGGVFGEDPPLQQQTTANKPVSKILSPVGGQANPQFPNPNFQTSSSNKTNIKRTNQKEQEETLLKMFEAHSGGNTSGGNSSDSSKSSNKQQQNLPPPDEFTRWSCDTVEKFGSGSVDIPTFINFLKEVDSPFEVNDYVRSYLGDTRESREFAKEFVERRSRWKNKGTDDTGAFEDNLCLPASAINPNQNDFQEVKAKGKKGKKQKMQKVDTRILGFNVSGDRTE